MSRGRISPRRVARLMALTLSLLATWGRSPNRAFCGTGSGLTSKCRNNTVPPEKG